MRKVLVWRDYWLPPSETFILNQLDALPTWTPRLGGVEVVERRLLEGRDVQELSGNLVPRRVARSGLRIPRFAPPLRKMIKDVDLVHAHFGPDATTVLDAANAFKKPRVISFHGYDATTARESRIDWPMTKRWDELTNEAGLIIAVSKFIAERLVDEGVHEHVLRVLHTGIPIPTDEGVPPSERTPSILFVGRLVEKKGVDVLLNAIALLPPDLRSISITIIGDGPLGPPLRTLARSLGLRVNFRGTQSPAQAVDAMREHSLFVAPSRTAANGDAEGFGMVFLEAASVRMPVITTRSGGNVDAVDHGSTGLVLDPDDPQKLADAIGLILRDGELADSMGSMGRERVIDHFDVKKQSAKLENEYDRVVGLS